MAEDAAWANFTTNLNTRRTDLGLTQTALRQSTGFDAATISRWVNGKARPNPQNLVELAIALRVNPAEDLDLEPGKFNDKYRDDVPWNSNDESYETFVMNRLKSAKDVKLALISEQSNINKNNRPRELADDIFRQRVLNDDLKYQIIETFYTVPRFVNALHDAYLFSNTRLYRARYFLKPPHEIPAINLRIIDDEMFLFGAFGSDEHMIDKVWEIHGTHPLAAALTDYWARLYSKSEKFTESPSIDDEARKILGSLNMKGDAAEDIVRGSRLSCR